MSVLIDRLQALSEAFGPSGFEEEVVQIITRACADFDVSMDPLLNVYAHVNHHDPALPLIQLDAHSDEVGFIVQYINDKGLIGFLPLGGWIGTNLPAHSVWIKNRQGRKIRGIITSKPPHFMTDAERQNPIVDYENTFIDVGASCREEVIDKLQIQPGDPIAPEVSFSYDQERGICMGKAFDNRLGCLCILETMERLNRIFSVPARVTGAFAAQEEVGMRGAHLTAQKISPDLAIVFEGSPADDLYYQAWRSQGALGQGVQIRYFDQSYVSNPVLADFAAEMALKHKIPFQKAVRKGGSTNAGKIHLAGSGVPVLVLGIPTRYVHSHYNYCHAQDIEHTINLAVKTICALNADKMKQFKRQNLL